MEHRKRLPKLYLLAFVLGISIPLILSYFFTIGRANGISMSYTIQNGDITLQLKNLDIPNIEPSRGDIINFKSPVFENVNFAKRVIGIPGDEIRIDSGKVYLNGEELKEDYIRGRRTVLYNTHESHWIVPEGHVFVLGDNREKGGSMDKGLEWLTRRELKVRLLQKVEIKTDEILSNEELYVLMKLDH